MEPPYSLHGRYGDEAQGMPLGRLGDGDAAAEDPHIGRIYLSDISTSRYRLPDEVKKTARRWMRSKNQITTDDRTLQGHQSFQELCDDLDFNNRAHPKALRDICIYKLGEFIRNEGYKFSRSGQFRYDDDTGTRVWASFTDAWLGDSWGGDTADPDAPRSRAKRASRSRALPAGSLARTTAPTAAVVASGSTAHATYDEFLTLFDRSLPLWDVMGTKTVVRHILDSVMARMPGNSSGQIIQDLVDWLGMCGYEQETGVIDPALLSMDLAASGWVQSQIPTAESLAAMDLEANQWIQSQAPTPERRLSPSRSSGVPDSTTPYGPMNLGDNTCYSATFTNPTTHMSPSHSTTQEAVAGSASSLPGLAINSRFQIQLGEIIGQGSARKRTYRVEKRPYAGVRGGAKRCS